ncbi:MAG: PD-(D/E)XK nuclease domain-containing protein [Caldilineaceae bacterium]
MNNLKDLTLHRDFASLTGYTQQEVEFYFGDDIGRLAAERRQSQTDLLAEIRTWYNGYSWDGHTTLYNPFSLMSFIDFGEFRNFWFETGTPTFLLKLLRQNRLYRLDNFHVNELSFAAYDIEKLQVLPILFQTGYLTIQAKEEFDLYQLGYPNQEVQSSMLMYLIGELSYTEPALSTPMVVQLYRAFLGNDVEQVINLIRSIFKNIPSHIFIDDAEAYYHSLIYLVFFYLGQFTESEINTNNGRLDCVVQTPMHIYILEFKLDKSAEAALQQIKERGYAEKYAADPRAKILVGINFSREQKSVEGWQMETYS